MGCFIAFSRFLQLSLIHYILETKDSEVPAIFCLKTLGVEAVLSHDRYY